MTGTGTQTATAATTSAVDPVKPQVPPKKKRFPLLRKMSQKFRKNKKASKITSSGTPSTASEDETKATAPHESSVRSKDVTEAMTEAGDDVQVEATKDLNATEASTKDVAVVSKSGTPASYRSLFVAILLMLLATAALKFSHLAPEWLQSMSS